MTIRTAKAVILLIVGGCAAVAGFLFTEHREYREAVVVSPYISEVKRLSDYSDSVKNSVNDANVYIFNSGVPGGTVVLIGGTHPEEPVANLSAQIFTENVKPLRGRIIVNNRINRSASLGTRMGEAYPRFFHVNTPWGVKRWRYGDRVASPLDSWPDPEVYIHFPSGQNLAYMDVRNANRTWPGRPDGLPAERTCFAAMELIRNEKADIVMDFHEAELEYAVENTIVVHEKGQSVAAMASMMLTSQTFDVPIGMEFSPKALHGLSHREIGDHSEAVSYLAEVAEPMLDRIRGITDEELLMSGKDRFVMKAGEHKLLYAPIDENGWPVHKRTARHVTTLMTILQVHNMLSPDKTVILEGIPTYAEMMNKGLGPFFADPGASPAERVFYD